MLKERCKQRMQPRFITGPAGRLFTLLYPAAVEPAAEWIIHLPAFAEQMNKSRPMLHKQAVAFSDKGAAVLVPDLYGTGDSDGDFSAASWQIWKQDIRFLVRWVKSRGARKVTLWGLRAGALMALDLVSEGLDDVSHLILWQPVHSGEQLMTQFLRLRMAASMMSAEQETVAALRARLHAGETLEVAGYPVAPALLKQLEPIALKNLTLPAGVKIDWLEVVSAPTKPLRAVTQKCLDLWQSQGVDVQAKTVVGEPFWTTQEITWLPALVEVTAALIAPSLPSDVALSAAAHSCWSEPDSQNIQIQAEQGVVFPCEDETLLGVLHRPNNPQSTGILIIVGGPQYRVGSHRQFVHLARYFASQNIPVMRFDYRGMGDASGNFLGFEHVQLDIRCAVDHFMQQMPELKNVVLWGLCDAATAACFYAPTDERVAGLVLLNPWVRSEAGEAKAFLKHYYLQRFLSKSLWHKVFKGEFNISASFVALVAMFKRSSEAKPVVVDVVDAAPHLAEKIETSLHAFKGPVQCILSGNDLVAAEFNDAVKGSARFTRLMQEKRFRHDALTNADHTFSKGEWREQVAACTVDWMRTL